MALFGLLIKLFGFMGLFGLFVTLFGLRQWWWGISGFFVRFWIILCGLFIFIILSLLISVITTILSQFCYCTTQNSYKPYSTSYTANQKTPDLAHPPPPPHNSVSKFPSHRYPYQYTHFPHLLSYSQTTAQ